ncbi:DUF1178 family protein [Chelatococcus sp. SYSU_G07232]|uniref:DUF1178 family protein n=1 Tax=Chelatococcus albus TaxID=3047466 RepID=A0ABT7ADJ7_9HYPH|nr:DUF1178 family protein [Chelatococcus sp. SYSU_G07232]MDJ1157454.1 DUF1178 family protein [Chelatococcus sp. SYSU_G07232]
MIRYTLVCDQAHEFESWFPDSAAYDAQVGRGLVTCPTCGSHKVGKTIMAPAVVARREAKPAQRPAPAQPEAPAQVALLSEKERQMRDMLRALKRHVVEHAENVGERFPEEARRMHAGDIEERAIYGKATADEARALIEEGIDVMPLPVLPDERN